MPLMQTGIHYTPSNSFKPFTFKMHPDIASYIILFFILSSHLYKYDLVIRIHEFFFEHLDPLKGISLNHMILLKRCKTTSSPVVPPTLLYTHTLPITNYTMHSIVHNCMWYQIINFVVTSLESTV